MIEMVLAASDRVGYRGAVIAAMGGGHTPEGATATVIRLAQVMPTVIATRTGGGPMLRQTYGGPSSEIALRKAGLIWGGRLHPLKARVLLETCLRAGLERPAIAEVFDAFGQVPMTAIGGEAAAGPQTSPSVTAGADRR